MMKEMELSREANNKRTWKIKKRKRFRVSRHEYFRLMWKKINRTSSAFRDIVDSKNVRGTISLSIPCILIMDNRIIMELEEYLQPHELTQCMLRFQY